MRRPCRKQDQHDRDQGPHNFEFLATDAEARVSYSTTEASSVEVNVNGKGAKLSKSNLDARDWDLRKGIITSVIKTNTIHYLLGRLRQEQ